MQTIPSVPVAPVRSARAPCKRALKRVSQFDRCLRPQLRALAERDYRFADLALTFPALLVALAHPRRRALSETARALVLAGGSLKEVAAAAEVPMWLRTVHPRAFNGPLPRLPGSLSARLEMPNYVPREASRVTQWLSAVAMAFDVGNETISLWTAREFHPARHGVEQARRIALWAWLSTDGQGFSAERLIDRPWTASMTWCNAREAANDFIRAVYLHVLLKTDRDRDPWIGPSRMLGYDFVPLLTADDLAAEGAAMHHCVRECGPDIARNYTRVFGIRANGERVATVEICHWGCDPYPWITQLQGPSNSEVPRDVWLAARRWLVTFSHPRAIATSGNAVLDPKAWREVWKPYWLAKRKVPGWLPLAPPSDLRGI